MYRVNQGSSVQGEWAEVFTEDGRRIVRVVTDAGKAPVIHVFADGPEATHVIDLAKPVDEPVKPAEKFKK